MEPINKTIRQNNNLLFQSADALPQLPLLPQELIKTIFSGLSNSDLQDAASVTKLWNDEIICYTKETTNTALKSIMNGLIKQLSDVHANEISALKALIDENKPLESTHLQNIKSSFMEIEEKILGILVDVDPLVLKNENQHPLFNNFFESLGIFKTVKYVNEGNMSLEQKDDLLYDLPAKLAVNGLFNKALSVATTISDPVCRASSIEKIINTLSEKKQYNDVINIVNTTYHLIPSFYNIPYVVSTGLKNAGQEKALKLASKISNSIVQGEVINLLNKYYDAVDLIYLRAHYGII